MSKLTCREAEKAWQYLLGSTQAGTGRKWSKGWKNYVTVTCILQRIRYLSFVLTVDADNLQSHLDPT